MKRYFTLILLTLFACRSTLVAKFDVVDVNGLASTILIYEDSSYLQLFTEKGETQEEWGKWKGGFEPDSVFITYIELEDGSLLSSSKYRNIRDTLRLIEWSIR